MSGKVRKFKPFEKLGIKATSEVVYNYISTHSSLCAILVDVNVT